MSLYKVIQVVGTSEVSWEDAAKNAINTARQSINDLRIGEVTRMDVKIEDGKMIFRTKIDLSFRYTAGD
ncbi:MAG: dodecin family protein [Pirellulaceae bacterium]